MTARTSLPCATRAPIRVRTSTVTLSAKSTSTQGP